MTLMEEIEQMSDADKKALLEANFGEEMEKEASAELAKADLADALYSYGAYMADREIEEQESLSKEASEEFDSAHSEITSAIEQGLVESGILETEDTAALHQEAQAAAGIIFRGYSDQVEKLAADEGKMAKMKKWMGEKAEKGKEAAKGAAKSVGAHMGKHKGKYGLGAAALAAGAGAYGYKKHHEKKASELTASELSEIVQEEQYLNAVITEGFSKLAEAGEGAAKSSMTDKMKAGFGKLKSKAGSAGKAVGSHMMKHKGKYGIGAAALGAGAAAHQMMKKKD